MNKQTDINTEERDRQQKVRQTDRQTGRRTVVRTERQTNGRTDRRMRHKIQHVDPTARRSDGRNNFRSLHVWSEPSRSKPDTHRSNSWRLRPWGLEQRQSG